MADGILRARSGATAPGNGGRKTQTNARDLKPKRVRHQASTTSHPKSQAGAAEALALGRTDALDPQAVLSLQKTAGNATVTAAIEGRTLPVQRRGGAPAPAASARRRGAIDAASLFAAEAPDLVPLIPKDQLKTLQERYDARAINADAQKRLAILNRQLRDDPYNQVLPRKISKVFAEQRVVPDGSDEITVPTASVLDADIQKAPAGDEQAEAAFRKSVIAQLLKTPVVTVRIADRALSAMERGDDGPYTKPEVLLECGGVKLPHTRGKVTFADLTSKGGSPYAQKYDREVTNRVDVTVLRYQLAGLEKDIDDAEVEHKDLRSRGESHPVVKATAEFLGGPSITEVQEVILDAKKHPEKGTLEDRMAELEAPEPPLSIWHDPHLDAKQAGELLAKHEVTLAALGLMRAQRSAALAFGAYERYERRVMKGAGVAVKWLERAKEAGKLAVEVGASELGLGPLAKAGLAGAYSFVQGEAEHKEGKSHWDVAKDAGVEAAMSYMGDKFKDGFKDALKERFAVQLKAYPDLAEHVIESTAGMSAAFYKAPMETVTKRIISGGKMPKNTKEWADMIAKETLTEATAGASGKDLNQALTKFVIKMTGSEPEHGKEAEAH